MLWEVAIMKYRALSEPLLYDSQLKARLGLAKKRLEAYPLTDMNFVAMDLERPKLRTRHAHWCTYDLTGRTLFFYALAEGIDGKHIERLPELYQRIMNNRRESGMFGNSFNLEGTEPEKAFVVGTHFVSGLVNYYTLTGDMRALNAAKKQRTECCPSGMTFTGRLLRMDRIRWRRGFQRALRSFTGKLIKKFIWMRCEGSRGSAWEVSREHIHMAI